MEVVVPARELHFKNATTTPFISAPSSPKHFGVGPVEFYKSYAVSVAAAAAVDDDDDFAFNFIGHLEKNAPSPPPLASADELFEQGKIRPLRPPSLICSPQNPFAAATNRRKNSIPISAAFSPTISHSQRHQKSRSLPSLRDGEGSNNHFAALISSQSPPVAAISCSWKMRIKEFLLFRSASEGNNKFLRKFTALPSSPSSPAMLKKEGRDVRRSSSFQSVDSNGGGSSRRAVSAHARHYTANKAVAEGMKKKTALPYRQSFFSCLPFSPSLHSLTTKG